MTREALAAALWRVRLYQTRTRCLYVAESSLAGCRPDTLVRPTVATHEDVYQRTVTTLFSKEPLGVDR